MVPFRNDTKNTLTFELGGSNYRVAPGETVHIAEKYAPFVAMRGTPLTPLAPIEPQTPTGRTPSTLDVIDAVRSEMAGFKADVLRVAESAAGDVARSLRDAVGRFGETEKFVAELGQRFQSFDERLVALEKGLLEVRSVPAPKGKRPAAPEEPPAPADKPAAPPA